MNTVVLVAIVGVLCLTGVTIYAVKTIKSLTTRNN